MNEKSDKDTLQFTVTDVVAPSAPTNLTLVDTTFLQHPELAWDPNTETDLDKYYIYRWCDEGGWGYIGNTTDNEYIDETVTCGIPDLQFKYRIKARDEVGNYSDYSNTTETFRGIYKMQLYPNGFTPDTYFLAQNFPNPFNPTTNIEFFLVNDINVKLFVYNLQGQTVVTLVDGFFNAGYHTVEFNASHLPSGIYFYKIIAGGFVDLKRMLLIK